MNKIFNDIVEARHGMYCHAMEVQSSLTLESLVDEFMMTFGEKYTCEEYIEFFQSMEIHYLPYEGEEEDPEEEQAIYNMSMSELIKDIYPNLY